MGELKGCLQAVLQERVVAAGPDNKGLVTLSERREKGRSSMHVQVSNVPSTTTVVRLGRKASQHSILRESPGESWMKICDYILINEGADDCEVVMVELKSTLQRQDGLEQLRRSLPIAKYLLAVCEVELQRTWPCRIRYALLAEKRTNRLDKQPIRPGAQLSTEGYKDINVAVGVGTRFDFGALTAGS